MQLDGPAVMAIGIGAFVFCGILVAVVRRIVLRFGVADRPRAGRFHTASTPTLGGVAMLAVTLCVAPIVAASSGQGLAILGGAAVVGALGVLDDLKPLRASTRIVVEVAAAAIVFAIGVRVRFMGAAGDFAFTVGWLVLVSNSFNLLDNMDGVAATVGFVTAVALAIGAMMTGQFVVAALAAVVAGCCLGFLVHNWHPARIFMGDVGSLFLGFTLGAISLQMNFDVSRPTTVVVLVLLLAPALFDTTLVVISRVREGRSVMVGGTDHTSHRLLRVGLTTPMVAGVLAVATSVSASLAILVGRRIVPAIEVAVPAAIAGIALLALFLRVPAERSRSRAVSDGPRADAAIEQSPLAS